MTTLRLNIAKSEYDKSVNTAAEILKNGGVVGLPTETVYGIAASAYEDNTIKKVFGAYGQKIRLTQKLTE